MLLSLLRPLSGKVIPFKSVMAIPIRRKIWITKSEPPEWLYADQDDLMNVELANAVDQIKSSSEKLAFLIVDLREGSELEMMDFPKRNKH